METRFQLFLFISEHTDRHGCSTRGAKLRLVKGLQIKVVLKDTGYEKQLRAQSPQNKWSLCYKSENEDDIVEPFL